MNKRRLAALTALFSLWMPMFSWAENYGGPGKLSDYGAEFDALVKQLGPYAAFIGAFIVVILIVVVLTSAVVLVSMWRAFTKAGEAGWKALIPGYNFCVMAELGGKPSWWGWVTLLPWVSTFLFVTVGGGIPFSSLISMVMMIFIQLAFVRAFDKDIGFLLGIVILPFIFWPILAFGSARYVGPRALEG